MISHQISSVDIRVQMFQILGAGIAAKLANLAKKPLQVCPLHLLLLRHSLLEGWTAMDWTGVTVIIFEFLQ